MIDRSHIGLESEPLTVEVEKGRLRFFARATGQKDPVYLDEEAARKAGHPSLPVPPTFLCCLEMETDDAFVWLAPLNVEIGRILHGSQRFRYHRMSFAGDRLTFRARIADIYDKKNGALEFIVKETKVTNQNDEHVADLESVIVVRNG